jgi:hypothetical protein
VKLKPSKKSLEEKHTLTKKLIDKNAGILGTRGRLLKALMKEKKRNVDNNVSLFRL